MPTLSKSAALVLAIFTSGCAYMAPIHLEATPADMEMLAGEWSGEYNSPALGRRGTIEFKLKASVAQASGVVVMIPQGAGRPYGPSSLRNEFDSSRILPTQLLTIRFVRAQSGEITGMLEPYWDPDRNCEATTRFIGYLAKGVIEGKFTTTFDCGVGAASGTWQVTHKGDFSAAAAK